MQVHLREVGEKGRTVVSSSASDQQLMDSAAAAKMKKKKAAAKKEKAQKSGTRPLPNIRGDELYVMGGR